jgi:hypothetical protein
MAELLKIPIQFTGPEGQPLSLGTYVAIQRDVCNHLESIAKLADEVEVLYRLSAWPGSESGRSEAQKKFQPTMEKLRSAIDGLKAISGALIISADQPSKLVPKGE